MWVCLSLGNGYAGNHRRLWVEEFQASVSGGLCEPAEQYGGAWRTSSSAGVGGPSSSNSLSGLPPAHTDDRVKGSSFCHFGFFLNLIFWIGHALTFSTIKLYKMPSSWFVCPKQVTIISLFYPSSNILHKNKSIQIHMLLSFLFYTNSSKMCPIFCTLIIFIFLKILFLYF